MSKRARFHVMLVVAAVVGSVYGQLSGSWGTVAFVTGLFGVIAVVGMVGLPWMESAPDGAFRRGRRA
jgi:hypothetical protein